MLNTGFATVDDLKCRLRFGDNIDDTLLLEILTATAGAIENAAGRTLRREHARVEVFEGGGRTLRVGVWPIAKVHSIRESEGRDFSDSDNYIELTEDTDYVLQPGPHGMPGSTGIIRRLNANWAGSVKSPGKTQVIYTGGYKTDGEIELEDTTGSLTTSGDILSYGLKQRLTGGSGLAYTYQHEATGDIHCFASSSSEMKVSFCPVGRSFGPH